MSTLTEQIDHDLGQRYQGLVFIGDGGYATVWRAYDLELQSWVAVKRILVKEQDSRAYYRELATLFRLSHPNINKLLTIQEGEGNANYLILEYCAGGHLGESLQSMKKPKLVNQLIPLCSSVILQIAAALDYAHSQDFIHRDIKPANVLVSNFQGVETRRNNWLKVSDFGLARGTFPSPTGASSKLKGLTGTPLYMAPELFAGEKASPASDIYALGVIAYEVLHGRPPFQGTAQDIARGHCYDDPEFDQELDPDWLEFLTSFVSKEPSQRPSASDITIRIRELKLGPRRLSRWLDLIES